MARAPVPYALADDALEISGVRLRCYVLNDGRRVINAEDVDALFAAWGAGSPLTEEEAASLARWM